MMPEIIQIVSSPGRISKKGETYTIKVILDDHFAGEAEYSIDNAQWQTSNTFPRLVPGEYEIFVRNSRQDAYRDSKPVKLLEEPKITLTVDEANDLLSRVSDGDDEAKKKLKQCFGNSILVVGVENINTLQDLLRDCCVLGNRYEIISISGNKITVRNK